MTKSNILKQKIKGKLQQAKGAFEMNTGNQSKGIIDKAKGSVNDSISDIRMALTNNSSHE